MPSAFDYVGNSNLFSSGIVDGKGGLGQGIGTGLADLVTGDVSYARQLESMGMQNAFNASQSALERDFASREAKKNRDWQERMSNSAYSRAISDLKSSGVNPYAVLSGLNGASTPSGATATGSTARSGSGVSNTGNGLASMISSAFSLVTSLFGMKNKMDIAKLNADTRENIAKLYTGTGYDMSTFDRKGHLLSRIEYRKR